MSSHFKQANGSMWSRQRFFGLPLWQLTLGGSIVLAVAVTPTLFRSWNERYRSSYIDYSRAPPSQHIKEDVQHAIDQNHQHHVPHHHIHHVAHGECPEHPHVHAEDLHLDVHDISHHNHAVLLSRLEKERKWIMFG